MTFKRFFMIAVLLAWFGKDGYSQGTACAVKGAFTAAANGSTLNNRIGTANTPVSAACVSWKLTYESTGFSALSISIQGAPDNAGAAGTWADIASGFITQGSNPSTELQAIVSAAVYFPFMRVKLNSVTGTGTVYYRLEGVAAPVVAQRGSGGGGGAIGVASFNARTGVVVPASGDYTAAQVTNAADKTADNDFGAHFQATTEIATPATPAATKVRWYGKGGTICAIGSAGVEQCIGSAPVVSVFGRTGAVVAAGGDYTAAQVTDAARTDAGNDFNAFAQTFGEIATPSNPGAGDVKLYAKTGTNNICALSSAGVETCTVSSIGGGADPATFNLSAAIASLPSAGTTGRTYLPTDSYYDILRDNGSTWNYWVRGVKVTAPAASGSWTNVNSATITHQTNGAVILTAPSTGATATNDIKAYVTATGSAPWSKVIRMYCTQYPANFTTCGATMRESATGKLVFINVQRNTVDQLKVSYFTSPTAFSADRATLSTSFMFSGGQPYVFRLSDDSTNIKFEYSLDQGAHFTLVYSEARGASFTTAPDQIGFMGNAPTTNTNDVGAVLLSVD